MKNASRLPFGMAFFCAQVLDFYRRPMLYYYNDCEYVHFQHSRLRGRISSDTGAAVLNRIPFKEENRK